jgi:MFS family permease
LLPRSTRRQRAGYRYRHDGGVDAQRLRVSAGFGAQGLSFATVLTHLPAYTDRWALDQTAVTLVVLAVSVAAGAGSLAASVLAGRLGSPRTLVGALVVVALAAAATVLAPTLVTFYAAFAFWGAAVGGVDAAMNMQAVAVQHRLGTSVMAGFHATWSLGGILGALWTSADAVLHLGLTPAVLVVAALVVVLALLARDPSPPPVSAPLDDVPPSRVRWRPVLVVGAAVVAFYVVDSAVSSWSSLYLRDVLRTSTAVAALGFAAYQGTSLLSRAVGDAAVRRWGAVAIVRAAGVLGALGLLAVITAPSTAVAVAGFAVTGLGLAVVTPLAFATTDRLPEREREETIARLNLFNYLGFVLGGVLVGAVGSGNLRMGYVVPAVGAVAVAGIATSFRSAPRPAPAADTV